MGVIDPATATNSDEVEAYQTQAQDLAAEDANQSIEHYQQMSLISLLAGVTFSFLQFENMIFKKSNDLVGQLSV